MNLYCAVYDGVEAYTCIDGHLLCERHYQFWRIYRKDVINQNPGTEFRAFENWLVNYIGTR